MLRMLKNSTRKMKTYNFVHGNSSAVITLSAETDEEAEEVFADVTRRAGRDEFRLETIEEDCCPIGGVSIEVCGGHIGEQGGGI
jgi:hypothetical protein